jgi:hypothetical protein
VILRRLNSAISVHSAILGLLLYYIMAPLLDQESSIRWVEMKSCGEELEIRTGSNRDESFWVNRKRKPKIEQSKQKSALIKNLTKSVFFSFCIMYTSQTKICNDVLPLALILFLDSYFHPYLITNIFLQHFKILQLFLTYIYSATMPQISFVDCGPQKRTKYFLRWNAYMLYLGSMQSQCTVIP